MEKLRFTGGDIRLSVSCIHVVYHCVTCRQLRLGKGGDSVRTGRRQSTGGNTCRPLQGVKEMCIHTLGKEDKKQKTEEERQETKDRGRKDRERKTEVGKTGNERQR